MLAYVIVAQGRDLEFTARTGGISGIPEGIRIAPADLTEDITWNSGKPVDTLESFEDRRCVNIFIVGVDEFQDVAVEAKEESNLRSSTQVRNNRCRSRSFALIDDKWVVDGYLAFCIDDRSFSKCLLGTDGLRTRREESPRG